MHLAKSELTLLEAVCSGELLAMEFLKARVPQIDIEAKKLDIMNLRQKLSAERVRLQEADAILPRLPAFREKRKK